MGRGEGAVRGGALGLASDGVMLPAGIVQLRSKFCSYFKLQMIHSNKIYENNLHLISNLEFKHGIEI